MSSASNRLAHRPDDSVDPLMVWTPTARRLKSKDGVPRWWYNGKVYREIPLEVLFQEGGDYGRDSKQQREIERLMLGLSSYQATVGVEG